MTLEELLIEEPSNFIAIMTGVVIFTMIALCAFFVIDLNRENRKAGKGNSRKDYFDLLAFCLGSAISLTLFMQFVSWVTDVTVEENTTKTVNAQEILISDYSLEAINYPDTLSAIRGEKVIVINGNKTSILKLEENGSNVDVYLDGEFVPRVKS